MDQKEDIELKVIKSYNKDEDLKDGEADYSSLQQVYFSFPYFLFLFLVFNIFSLERNK